MMECQVTYIMSCIRKLVASGGSSLDCRPEPLQSFLDSVYTDMKKRVWVTSCSSWYKNDRGVVYMLWPNNCISYWWKVIACRMKDFKVGCAKT